MSEVEKLERLAEDAPIVRVVNLIFTNAIRKEATEIRGEPDEGFVVSYMLEGQLMTEMVLPKKMGVAAVARLKVMSHLDLVKHDSQEGELPLLVGRNDERKFRIKFEPAQFGEKVTIRIAD